MLTSVALFLIVFYAGAVCMTGRSWLAVWRGAAGFSTLRDLTGISDRIALMRLFGRPGRDGSYPVSFAGVFRHRRATGMVLTDLPVHLGFALLLVWAATHGVGPVSPAIILAASAHALVVSGAAVVIFARGSRALLR